MTYRPTSNSKKEIILSLSLAMLAIVLFALSGVVCNFVGLYQISSIICAIFGIEMYLKYVGSDYVYEAADSSFKVYKITGKKSICVCSLDYEMSLSYAVTNKEYAENKDNFPKANFNVNLAKNIAPSNYYVYFFEFNEKKSMLKFEPDAVFVDYLNKKIACTLDKGDCDDN